MIFGISSRGATPFFASALVIFASLLRADRTAAGDGPSWVVEHFADAVTILRLAGLDDRPSPGGIGVIMSCDGLERRFSMALSDAGEEHLGKAREGTFLLRRSGPPNAKDGVVVARFAVVRRKILIVTDRDLSATGQTVLSIARIFERQPERLDILIHAGAGPITFSGLAAYRLPMPVGPPNVAALREFIAVCSQRGSAKAGNAGVAKP